MRHLPVYMNEAKINEELQFEYVKFLFFSIICYND